MKIALLLVLLLTPTDKILTNPKAFGMAGNSLCVTRIIEQTDDLRKSKIEIDNEDSFYRSWEEDHGDVRRYSYRYCFEQMPAGHYIIVLQVQRGGKVNVVKHEVCFSGIGVSCASD